MNLVLEFIIILLAASSPAAAANMVTIEVEMTKDAPVVTKPVSKHITKHVAKPYRYTKPPHRRLLPK